MKKLFALLLAVLMVFALAACNNTNSGDGGETGGDEIPEEQRYGGHLNMQICAAPNYLDPSKSTGVWGYMWTSNIYEAPLTRDAEGNIRPQVCNFELSEDQLTLKLWVREGVKFHDGSLVEIEDVVASLQRAVHKSPRQFVAAYIKDIKIENGVATITFKEYNEKTMYYIACVNPFLGVMPKEIAEEFSNESKNFIMDIEDCVGTGPYKVTNFEVGVKIEFVRFEDYIAVEPGYTGFAAPKKAYLDSITVTLQTDNTASAMALLAGELDILHSVPEDFEAQVAAANLKYNWKAGTACSTFIFNTFGDSIVNTSADMRKAMVAAIDMDEFVKFMTNGKQDKAGVCPVYDDIYYTDVFEKADYMGPANVTLSKEYQKKAGYNGETITLKFPSSYSNVATICDSYWKAAGINVEIMPMESSAWGEVRNDPTGDWQFVFTYPNINSSPTLLSDTLLKTDYNSAEKDALLNELMKLKAGTPEYIAKWKELAAQMVDDCAVVYIRSDGMNWCMNGDLMFDYAGRSAYFFNTYWKNPADHGKK